MLSTGEMIDKLKVGEVAESVSVPGGKSLLNKMVTWKDGTIVWEEDEQEFQVNDFVVLMKWRILPQYVSFEDAMKALADAKKVHFHGGGGSCRVTYGECLENSLLSGFTFENLINGKWTIED